MRKHVLLFALAITLILFALPAASADGTAMVTITNPDGTVIEMSLADYMTMMGITSTSTGTQTTAPATAEPETTDEVPWPSYNLPTYSLDPVIKWESYRAQAFSGPSRNYSEVGAYKPYKISRADGILIEGSYVLVDMNYTTVGVRRVYFTRGTFHSTGEVPEVTLTGYPAVTTASVVARYGPGGMYDPYEEASVGANTPLTVFFEEKGYVFAEYEAGFKLVRAWINANSVKPQ